MHRRSQINSKLWEKNFYNLTNNVNINRVSVVSDASPYFQFNWENTHKYKSSTEKL